MGRYQQEVKVGAHRSKGLIRKEGREKMNYRKENPRKRKKVLPPTEEREKKEREKERQKETERKTEQPRDTKIIEETRRQEKGNAVESALVNQSTAPKRYGEKIR